MIVYSAICIVISVVLKPLARKGVCVCVCVNKSLYKKVKKLSRGLPITRSAPTLSLTPRNYEILEITLVPGLNPRCGQKLRALAAHLLLCLVNSAFHPSWNGKMIISLVWLSI